MYGASRRCRDISFELTDIGMFDNRETIRRVLYSRCHDG